MTRSRRRALLYGIGLAAAAAILFAGYGITVPPDAGTRLNGATFLAGLGQYDQALAACDQVLREHPGNPDAYVFRATFLTMAGRNDEALRAYDDAIAHVDDEGTRADLVLDRASVLLEAGRVEEFRKERERLVAAGAGHRLDVYEGMWAERERRWDDAVAAYGRAVSARPKDPQIAARLYGSLLEQGRQSLAAGRFDAARASFDRAVELFPGASDARLRAAEVRLATDDLDGAVAQLREAGARAPGVAPLVFRAATLLLERGRREEALDALAAAVAADGDGTRLLLQNETVWHAELKKPDVIAVLESERHSIPPALTADGGVINDPRNSGDQGGVR